MRMPTAEASETRREAWADSFGKPAVSVGDVVSRGAIDPSGVVAVLEKSSGTKLITGDSCPCNPLEPSDSYLEQKAFYR
jgi:hypothetical protein